MSFSGYFVDDNVEDEKAEYGCIILIFTPNDNESSDERNSLGNSFQFQQSLDGNLVNILKFDDLFLVKKFHFFDVGMQLQQIQVHNKLNIQSLVQSFDL